MITPVEVNPYAPDPEHTASAVWQSGGGGDGQVLDIVGWLLRRVDPRPAVTPTLGPPEPGGRGFDFAELVAWAADAAGGSLLLPDTAVQLRASCWRHRTVLRTPGDGRVMKGSLLFGGGMVAVTTASRDRVITYDQAAGVVLVPASWWVWTEAARIPGARGYPA